MWTAIARWGVRFSVLLVLTCVAAKGQEDSLRSALSAVNRRQRDLSGYQKHLSLYPKGGLSRYNFSPDDRSHLAFLALENERKTDAQPNQNPASDRALLDFLEDNDPSDGRRSDRDSYKKRLSSPFRERIEEDKERQREEFAKLFLNSLDEERSLDENDEYGELIQELLDKYQNSRANSNEPEIYTITGNRKRYYPSFGMKKRSRYFQPDGPNDSLYLLNYTPREEILSRLQEMEDDDQGNDIDLENFYPDRKYVSRERKSDNYQRFYPYAFRKRFPVSKRSSNYYPTPIHSGELTHQHKRSPNKEETMKTDPKVEKELSNIFESTAAKSTTKKDVKPTPKPKKNEAALKLKTSNNKKKEQKDAKPAYTKEIAQPVSKSQPLAVKKKSVDWSDYFGLDRRKKSEENLDNEWLMERYHKAMAITAKRSTDYPLQHFREHDQENKKKSQEVYEVKKDASKSEEAKIREMDEKLKSIEDSIVDDALKYTGAHEGTTDSKEIQEVKDKVISRLAAAYSLEKMRRALGEYKMNIAKERNRLKQSEQEGDYLFSEEKRLSVPRKQAIDEEAEKAQEEDNNIKCTQGTNCQDYQNYRIPAEILEQYKLGIEECPEIQRECHHLAIALMGQYSGLLETACRMHQLCLMCVRINENPFIFQNDNSWSPPTQQCKALYLSKASELCEGNADCQNFAQLVVDVLIMNRSLRTDQMNECNLVCPESKR